MSDLTQLQVDFCIALAGMEERCEHNGKTVKKIDVDENHLLNCLLEAKKPLDELLRRRLKAARYCKFGKGDKKPKQLQSAVMERCAHDQIYWVNNWCWIFNPWLTKFNHIIDGGFPAKLPFILFKRQEEYLHWREKLYLKNESGVVYKCREVGASWLSITNQAWHWFFEPYFQGRIGSRKEKLIDDKGNPDTIFEKLRIIIYNCPTWMRPRAFEKANNACDSLLKIKNPENGSVITGEGGDGMGVGGRASIYDCDEWATVEHAKAIDANISNNSRVIFYTSTPKGPGNDFAAKIKDGQIAIFDFRWTDDPRKTQDWYDNFKDTHDEAITAQEVDRKFDAFNTGSAIREDWVDAAVELHERIHRGQVMYESEERVCGLDVAAGGRNRSVYTARQGIVVKDVIEWNIDNTTRLVEKAGTQAEVFGAQILNFDPVSVGVGARSTFQLRDYNFIAVPVDSRSPASSRPLPGDTKPANERCINRRAEIVCRVRKRFEKTFEYIKHGVECPIEEMIAIPNNSKLRAQLPIPELLSENGKFKLESKERMVRRGIDSPDHFDSLMQSFADERSEVRVIKNVGKSHCLDGDVPWGSVAGSAMHYVSIYHTKDKPAVALGALWWIDSKRLQIYNEVVNPNPTVSVMVSMIRNKFSYPVNSYVGNREMFGKQEEDSLFMQYLNYFVIYESFQYNELSAIAQLEQMFAEDRIGIYKECQTLRSEIELWDRKRGMPDRAAITPYCLCVLISHLEEQGMFVERKVELRGHYNKKVKPKEPVWMV